MKGKKLFAMLLASVMACSVFAGCSGGGGSNSGSGSSAAEESAAAEESGESGEDSQAEAGSTGEITWEDPYEVVMCYIYFGTLSEDLQMVEDAMNEIALEKTNTQVSLLPLSFSEISTQPSLMISSGEKLDLLLSPAQSDLMNYYNSNMLLELDELVEEYGQDILAAKSDVLDVGRIDGQLYAITGTRQHYNSQGLMVVTEYAEKYGLDTSQPVGYEELDAFFAAAKEGEGDSFYPFLISGTNVTSFEFFQRMDTLGADIWPAALSLTIRTARLWKMFLPRKSTPLIWIGCGNGMRLVTSTATLSPILSPPRVWWKMVLAAAICSPPIGTWSPTRSRVCRWI